ncbi:MAG: hypothetical protein AAGH74_10560, partial [Pseudomonadota bacterium]
AIADAEKRDDMPKAPEINTRLKGEMRVYLKRYGAVPRPAVAVADLPDAAAAAYAASAAASADAYASAAAAASASASADATFLEDGGGVKALSDRPLWPDGEMPEGLAEDSQALKSRLLAEGEDWEVWTDWYEDRLRGTQANLELERARVLIPNEDWEKGPAHVNGIIKRLIEEHGGGFRERAAQRIAAQPERTVADVRQQIVDLDALIAEKEKYRPNSDEAKEANKRELERLLSIRLTLTTVKEGAEALPVPATVEQAEPIADELVRLPAPVKETAEETAPDRRTQLWAAFVATIASFMVRFGMPMDFADLILRPVPGSEEVIERIKKMQEKD